MMDYLNIIASYDDKPVPGEQNFKGFILYMVMAAIFVM